MNAIAEQDGFEGLSFDSYGVFPLIKLDMGSFQTSEGDDLGTEFHCVMLRSRPKYLYRTNLPREDDRNEVVYSYDNATSASGRPLQDIFNDWRQKGLEPNMQPTRYVEVTARMVPSGQLVLLSVAQASVGNLSAYWAQMRFKGVDIKTAVTKVYRGKKVERTKNPFWPWAFAHAPDVVDEQTAIDAV